MRFSILTLFPEYFDSPLACSLVGMAREQGVLQFDFVNLREFGEGKYKAVDDKPYGGGAGMVMMPTVLEAAFGSLVGSANLEGLVEDVENRRELRTADRHPTTASAQRQDVHAERKLPHVIYLSPQGQKLTAAKARELTAHSHLAVLCGHYEGIDERAIEAFVHEEVSIGDYILTGGEPAALVLIEAVARFLPGVVGEPASVTGDTFESAPELAPGGLKYPVYTRPQAWRGKAVPEVLLSGHHAEISKWRRSQSEDRTHKRRPDLKKR